MEAITNLGGLQGQTPLNEPVTFRLNIPWTRFGNSRGVHKTRTTLIPSTCLEDLSTARRFSYQPGGFGAGDFGPGGDGL